MIRLSLSITSKMASSLSNTSDASLGPSKYKNTNTPRRVTMILMDVKKQPTKSLFQLLRVNSQVGIYAQTVSANQNRDYGKLSCAGFLIIFFGVKALTNTNVESRTWLIPLKLVNFRYPHHQLAPCACEQLFLYVSVPASRLHIPEHGKCSWHMQPTAL
jgi:hypothetical protein